MGENTERIGKSNIQKKQVHETNTLFFDPLVCVKCGYCKSTCPTYLAERDERFSPRGRLMLSLSLLEKGSPPTSHSTIGSILRIYNDLDTCSKCAECEKTCPVGLKPWLNFVRVKNKTFPGKVESFLARKMVKSKFVFGFLMRAGMMLRGASPRKSKALEYGSAPRKYTTPSSVAEKNRESSSERRGEKRYIFFPTCFGTTVFKESIKKTSEILSLLGVDFITPRGFLCCGAPLLLSGDEKNFSKHVDYVKKKLFGRNDGIKGVLVSGATCTWVMREFYGKMPEVHETSDFIISKMKEHIPKYKSESKGNTPKLLLHIPCHEKYPAEDKLNFFRELGFDVERTEFPCCGFGGSMFFKQVKMSKKLLGEILKDKKPDVVVSNSPGCVIQLSSSGKYVVQSITDLLHQIFFTEPSFS